MKILMICVVVIIVGFIIVPAYAGLAVSVSGGDWAVGDIGMGVSKETAGNNWTVTNEGTETESVYIKVEGTAEDWSPGSSAGEDTFVLKHDALGDWSSAVTNTNNGIFLTSLLADGTKDFDLQFTGPSSTTTGGEHTMTVTLTAAVFAGGDNLIVTHTQGDICPEALTITYKTVVTDLSGETKTWLAQNLGATQQAESATDASDASAGWYWQFNRKQGYKAGPVPSWTITSIDESSEWTSANDPCTLLLGTGWRIPTNAEWLSTDSTGGWNNYNEIFNSVLKLHAAGYLDSSSGTLLRRGTDGNYWSSTQSDNTSAGYICIDDTWSIVTGGGMGPEDKAYGFSLRCLKD